MVPSRPIIARTLSRIHRPDRRDIVRTSLFGGASAALPVTGQRHGAIQDAMPAADTGSSCALANSVLFLFGDSMCGVHRSAGTLFEIDPSGAFAIDDLPVVGLIGTNSITPDDLMTDSTAAASSCATGVKTINGAVGVDAARNSVPNMIGLAKDAGKSVWLVTTRQAKPTCGAPLRGR